MISMRMMDGNEEMNGDLIDLFAGMNVEMNLTNDANDYYDDFDGLKDYVNGIENDFVNENDLNEKLTL